MKLFGVLDIRAGYYGRILTERSDVDAIRGFQTVVNQDTPGNNYRKWPDDYALMAIGEFDERSGVITPFVSPLRIHSARELLDLDTSVTPIEAHIGRQKVKNPDAVTQ